MVERIKMKNGMHAGLGPSHIVLDGDPGPPPKGAQPSQFLADVRCGQTALWIKMPLGVEVGLSQGNFVLDGDPAAPKKGAHTPLFGPCLLWPNGWMDQGATRYECMASAAQPKLHCVRW